MTNRQYLTAQLSPLGFDAERIEVLGASEGVALDDPISVKQCDLALYNQIGLTLSSAMQNVSEGGYSISWNIEALKLFYRCLSAKLGKPNLLETQPKKKLRYRSL